jgi:hypothetical protein
LSLTGTSLVPSAAFTKHLFDVSRECQTPAIQRCNGARRSIELLYYRTGVPSNERLILEADVRATVAERADGTSTTVRGGPEDVIHRTQARLRLVAADGRLVPQGSAAAPSAAPPTARQGAAQTPQPRVAHELAVTRRSRQARAGDRAVKARTPVRLTRRGRLVVTAAAMLAIGAASIGVAGAAQATGHSGAPAGPGSALARVEIKPGESLWSVAEAYDPNADTRVVMGEIVQMNSLSSEQVQPGQVLWVPRD